MKFDDAQLVDQICYQMKLADYPRSLNRARINDLFNGVPPYSDQEVEENKIFVNVNDLEGTRLAHDARAQFGQAFLKPGNFFTATTDFGARHKRVEYGKIVTREVNKIMKRSIPFIECFRSKFAMNVLHGISPSGFRCKDSWLPEPFAVDDVMVPANTLLTMRNLPFFAIFRSFTAPELIKLTKGPVADKAWNQGLVDRILEWIDDDRRALWGKTWPEVWSPEKVSERTKSDGGFYAGDQCPTIDCWDFYYWHDSGKQSGWHRRMVLDSWATPSVEGGVVTATRRKGSLYDEKNDFLYNPGKRIWGSSRDQVINWQFADLSAVAPFRYHSVRSLGFLLYSVCQLQNRLRCRFNESMFENLQMYFRVADNEDAQRVLKVDLINRGFIDKGVEIVPSSDRFQVPHALVELGLRENKTLISQHTSSYTTQPQRPPDQREKTKFEVMAEVNAMTSLVSAALMQAYIYQVPEYREILRRFFITNSSDPDVRKFQAACLRSGLPRRLLNLEYWEVEPDRVMGAGNKTLEMAIAQQLMQYRNLYDPEPQRQILRDVTLAITDDPARADMLVPEQAGKITDSVHDAQLAAGALLQGLPVSIKSGINHIEYVESLLVSMMMKVQQIAQRDNMGTPDEIMGLQNMGAHIAQHIQLIAQDPAERQRVKQYSDQLSQLMNLVRAFGQRLAQQMQQAGQQPGGDGKVAELQAKIQSIKTLSDAKAANTRDAHAQRTAQRQLQWEMEQRRKEQEFQDERRRKGMATSQELDASRRFTEQELAAAGQQSAQDLATEGMFSAQELAAEQARMAQESEAAGEE